MGVKIEVLFHKDQTFEEMVPAIVRAYSEAETPVDGWRIPEAFWVRLKNRGDSFRAAWDAINLWRYVARHLALYVKDIDRMNAILASINNNEIDAIADEAIADLKELFRKTFQEPKADRRWRMGAFPKHVFSEGPTAFSFRTQEPVQNFPGAVEKVVGIVDPDSAKDVGEHHRTMVNRVLGRVDLNIGEAIESRSAAKELMMAPLKRSSPEALMDEFRPSFQRRKELYEKLEAAGNMDYDDQQALKRLREDFEGVLIEQVRHIYPDWTPAKRDELTTLPKKENNDAE